MKLTKEQLQEMIKLQGEMDNLALENNGIDLDTDLIQEKYIALKTELHEFINEVESFKFWKKHKGKPNQLEEAIDTIHFILSLMIDFEYDIQEDLEITDKQLEYMQDKSMNELYIMTDALLVDTYMLYSWKETLGSILVGIMIMLNKLGYTGDDIFEKYKEKNAINIKRQKDNY